MCHKDLRARVVYGVPGSREAPGTRAAEALLAEVRKTLMTGTYAPLPPALPAGPGPSIGASPPDGDRPLTVLDAIDEYIRTRETAGRAGNTIDSYRGHRNSSTRGRAWGSCSASPGPT